MPNRRRRAEEQHSRWRHLPLVLLFLLGGLSGVLLWAYAPDLPRDYLIERYGQPPSTFIDVGGTRAHIRDEGKADAMPLLLVAGDHDNIMPESMVYENFARYRRSPAPTDFKVFHHRPHLITAIEGWEEVADYALTWTARHTR